jgi:hypothetical protein
LTDAAISRTERLVLRALARGRVEGGEWLEIDRKLAGYLWREPDHAVIYEAIVRARSRDPEHWREQLAAQTTRMGFPDLDWESFLGPPPMGAPEATLNELIHELEQAVGRTG